MKAWSWKRVSTRTQKASWINLRNWSSTPPSSRSRLNPSWRSMCAVRLIAQIGNSEGCLPLCLGDN